MIPTHSIRQVLFFQFICLFICSTNGFSQSPKGQTHQKQNNISTSTDTNGQKSLKNFNVANKILFIRGGDGTVSDDEQLADITNYATTPGNHGWGEFADVLTAEGYVVEQIDEGFSICGKCSIYFETMDLSQYALIVFGSNNDWYYSASIDSVESYIRSGGSALFLSDGAFGQNFNDAPDSDQFFLDRFGWTMNQDAMTYAVDASEFTTPNHPILTNISAFDGEGVSPITLTNSSVSGVTSTILAQAEGVIRRNNMSPLGTVEPVTPNDASLIVATVDNGRIAGHFDRNTFFNLNGAGTDINKLSNKQLALNLVNWLAGCCPDQGTACDDADPNTYIDLEDGVCNCAGSDPIDIPSTVQAEDFADQSGLVVEPTADAGGGSNIGFINTGDNADYVINVIQAGTYDICLRAAAFTSGGTANIYFDNILATSIQVTTTGGWQAWQSFTASVELTPGIKTMSIVYTGNANQFLMNVNWIKFDFNANISFQLIDANTDLVIRNLNDGDTIDLTIDGTDLNIVAALDETVGWVAFDYDATANYSIEGAAPYAIGGDMNGDFFSWTPTIGYHPLTANAYTTGILLDTETIGFFVVQGCPTIGMSCNDQDACTINDVFDESCNCIGSFNDADADGVADVCDNCPSAVNANQVDTNLNGIGDVCETQCQPNHVLTNNYPATSVLDFKAQNTIQSSSQIAAGAAINFNAGTSITMTPGFEVNGSATFHSYILGCTP